MLVTGASGGVGSAAIQLAKARGACVIAVAGDKKQQSVLDAGADQALVRGDSLEAAVGENTVDVVVDLVGGKIGLSYSLFCGLLAVMQFLAPSRGLLWSST